MEGSTFAHCSRHSHSTSKNRQSATVTDLMILLREDQDCNRPSHVPQGESSVFIIFISVNSASVVVVSNLSLGKAVDKLNGQHG